MRASARNLSLSYRLRVTAWLQWRLICAAVKRHPWEVTLVALYVLPAITLGIFTLLDEASSVKGVAPETAGAFIWGIAIVILLLAGISFLPTGGEGSYVVDLEVLWRFPLSAWHTYLSALRGHSVIVVPLAGVILLPLIFIFHGKSLSLAVLACSFLIYGLFLVFFVELLRSAITMLSRTRMGPGALVLSFLLLPIGLISYAAVDIVSDPEYFAASTQLQEAARAAYPLASLIVAAYEHTPPAFTRDIYLSFTGLGGSVSLSCALLLLGTLITALLGYGLVYWHYRESVSTPDFVSLAALIGQRRRRTGSVMRWPTFRSWGPQLAELVRTPSSSSREGGLGILALMSVFSLLLLGFGMMFAGLSGPPALVFAAALYALVVSVLAGALLSQSSLDVALLSSVKRSVFVRSVVIRTLAGMSVFSLVAALWSILFIHGAWWILLWALVCISLIHVPNSIAGVLISGFLPTARKRGERLVTTMPFSFWKMLVFFGVHFILLQMPVVPILFLAFFLTSDMVTGLPFIPTTIAIAVLTLYAVAYHILMTVFAGWLLSRREMYLYEKVLSRRG